ncbi:MAG: pyridoxal 5'-phosphate synthase glutaminase subunit PdxT [Anaerolineales bacterium]|jgi:5'-phosphate synthase pdxT subunit
MSELKIGVLALQGDFEEHTAVLHRLGLKAAEIRLPGELEALDGLIIPGGESTTIGKLATTFELMEPLRKFAQAKPVWGTCAGAIFLSNDARREQPLLKVMDITVERNAFGRQVDSFIIDLKIEGLAEPEQPFPAVFIRAPLIASVGKNVDILAELPDDVGREATIVAARQGHLLATSFHPELTEDDRVHRMFVEMVKEAR